MRRGYGATFQFEAGERDYERGRDREDNPHAEGTREREEWAAGWEYAWWAECGDPDLPKWGEHERI